MNKRYFAVMLLMGLLLVGMGSSGTLAVDVRLLPSKDTLVIALKSDLSNLDPHKTAAYNDELALDLGYDTLVKLDFDLKTVKPGLATSWEVSPDALKYTFKLKKNVKFHSGKPVTAKDVVYSFQRWYNDTASPTRDRIMAMDKITAVDDYTVQITLKTPSETFLFDLTEPYACVVNKESIDKAASSGVPYGSAGYDGTGPFKFKEWKRNEYLLLERFDDYKWGSEIFDNPGPSPFKYVLIRPIPDTGMRMIEFETGAIDLVVGDALPATEIGRLLKHDKVTVSLFDQFYCDYVCFNMTKPIFKDVRVRRALNYAIPRDEYVHTIFSGYASPAYGPVTPNSAGYWAGLDKAAYKYNADMANKLFDEAGWKMRSDGFRYKDGQRLSFNLYYGVCPEYESGMPMLQAYLRESGVDLKLVPMDWGAFFAAINTGEQDTYIVGYKWRHTYRVLRGYFHSDRIPYPNRAQYSNPEVDKLFTIGETAASKNARVKAYDDIQRIINEDAVWLPLYHKTGWMGVSRRLVNFKPHAFLGTGTSIPLDYYKK